MYKYMITDSYLDAGWLCSLIDMISVLKAQHDLSFRQNQETLLSIRGSEFKAYVIPSKHYSCKGYRISNIFGALNIISFTACKYYR